MKNEFDKLADKILQESKIIKQPTTITKGPFKTGGTMKSKKDKAMLKDKKQGRKNWKDTE